MASSESESVQIKSSIRKSWIKQLSERYSGCIEEVVEEDDVNLPCQDISGDSVSTEHTDNPSSKTSTEDTECEVWHEHNEYRIEIVGGTEPPAEWLDMSERKQSTGESMSSSELDNSVDKDLGSNDSWKLTERDNESLEADMRKETGELNDAGLASDEESLMKTPVGTRREQTTTKTKAKGISAPTTYPSDFTAIRAGKATEMFTERMKSIEQKNTAKAKSRIAPVIATIGRFSSAFRRFEGREERSHSLDGSMPAIKVKDSIMSASASVSVSKGSKPLLPKAQDQKKLPRIPYDRSFSEKSMEQLKTKEMVRNKPLNSPPLSNSKPTRLVRTPVDSLTLSDPVSPTATSSRAAAIPVESSRLMRNVRDSCNAPDVVAATLLPVRSGQSPSIRTKKPSVPGSTLSANRSETDANEANRQMDKQVKAAMMNASSTQYSTAFSSGSAVASDHAKHHRDQTNPHFDIDIVIKRDPLPDTLSPEDFSREPSTTAITLGRDEVTVMKLDSHNQGSTVTPEVITVWDTEVPLKGTQEKVISPTKLHVTHLNKGIPLRLNSPPAMEQSVLTHSFIHETTTSCSTSRAERKERQLTCSQPQMEPVMIKIRPQPVTQWPSQQNGYQRSHSLEDEWSAKMRSSVALELSDPLLSASNDRAKHRTQLSNSERAIPKRRPVTYNAVSEQPNETIVQHRHQPQHSHPIQTQQAIQSQQMHRHQPQHTHPIQTQQAIQSQQMPRHQPQHTHPIKTQQAIQSQQMPRHQPPRHPQDQLQQRAGTISMGNQPPPLYYQEQPARLPTRQTVHGQQQRSRPYSQQITHQHQSRELYSSEYEPQVDEQVHNITEQHMVDGARNIASEKKKSTSLDDLRLLREGLVANTMAVFLSNKEPGKQYFGDHVPAAAGRKPPMVTEDKEYTREWVENSKPAAPLVEPNKVQRVQSPVHEEKKDRSWLLEKQPTSPPRITGGHRRRTRSLGRVTTKSKAITQMAKFFQEEAQLGATHRAASPVEDDMKSASAFDQFELTSASLVSVSRASVDELHSPRSANQWRSSNKPPTTKSWLQNKEDKSYRQPEPSDNRKSIQRPSAKDTNHALGGFSNDDRDSDVRAPRRSLIVREERMPQTTVKQTASRSKSVGTPVVDEREETNSIDDRPLAASAFKAWLGSGSRLQTPLEKSVEQSYQSHIHMDKRHKVVARTDHRHAPPKADLWWKQQNEMSSQRRQLEEPAREERKPVTESQLHVENVQPQSHAQKRNDPPYANYQAQIEGYQPVETDSQNPAEDYYAQIRKKPTAGRTHSHPTGATDENQLFVNVAPPKPERNSAYLSNNSLDNLSSPHAPHLPQRHELAEEERVEHVAHTADNRMYYNPYYEPEQHPEQHTQQYNPQQHPTSVDPYERSYVRDNYPVTDNSHYPVDERGEHRNPPNAMRENRLYQQQEPTTQSYNNWDQRNQPYKSWQDVPAPRPPMDDYRWSREQAQTNRRPTDDHRRPQEHRTSDQQYPHVQAVREWHVPRADPRYNTWSDRDRSECNRSRPVLAELRPHNTLSHSDIRSQSYRLGNQPVRNSLERPKSGDVRPDVLPSDRRPRRARSVPITRPPQQKSNRGGEAKLPKQKNPSRHDNQKPKHEKPDDRASKSSKSKDKHAKSKSHKEGETKHEPITVLPLDSTPLPDFIPSHYFNERAYGGPDRHSLQPQLNHGPQYNQSHPDYPSQPQMAYNQQKYTQPPPAGAPYDNYPTNQIPYNQQTANHMSHNQQPAGRIPYNQQQTNQEPFNPRLVNQTPYHQYTPDQRSHHQYPANETGYSKQAAYTTYGDRPRPGVGVMFNPIVGTTDF